MRDAPNDLWDDDGADICGSSSVGKAAEGVRPAADADPSHHWLPGMVVTERAAGGRRHTPACRRDLSIPPMGHLRKTQDVRRAEWRA